jgi:hypothetical protein
MEKQAEDATSADVWAQRQFWIAVLGIVAVIATLAFTARAANAAKVAAEAIPILERAYLYPLIVSETVADVIGVANYMKERGVGPNGLPPLLPTAQVIFKNFGKTPATLIYGEVTMSLTEGGPRVGEITDLPINYSYVLGHDDSTEPFPVKMTGGVLSRDQVLGIENGRFGLIVSGWMDYRDIWGKTQNCPVRFRYNPTLGRLEAHVPRDSESRKT